MKSKCPAKPFLKWAGGKQAISTYLVEQFPKDVAVYFEPFVGGGSVFLQVQPPKGVIGDLNGWLIDTYVAIRTNWVGVAAILSGLRNTKREYMRMRAISPSTLDILSRAAHLIYLNKTCFRGLFRVNGQDRFNVPYGAYKRRYYDPKNLAAVAQQLKRTEIRHNDFELCLHDISTEDFAYFDPPYFKLGGYSDFNRYTPDQFRAADHIRLAAFCRELDRRNVPWAMSNSDTPFIKRLFRGFRIRTVSNRREINLQASCRSIQELLITNY